MVFARILVAHEGFVGLDVSARADFLAQRLVDEREPLGDEVHPAAHRFAADLDAVMLPEDLFLAAGRKVVAVFGRG